MLVGIAGCSVTGTRSEPETACVSVLPTDGAPCPVPFVSESWRFRPDLHGSGWFCRPEPNYSATEPLTSVGDVRDLSGTALQAGRFTRGSREVETNAISGAAAHTDGPYGRFVFLGFCRLRGDEESADLCLQKIGEHDHTTFHFSNWLQGSGSNGFPLA
jgi:hypothetical protein